MVVILFVILCCVKSIDIEQWDRFELTISGPRENSSFNPFTGVTLTANFSNPKSKTIFVVNGFYDGDGIYKIRFMPDNVGVFKYTTSSNIQSMSNIFGNFTCIPISKSNIDFNRGPAFVNRLNNRSFIWADGSEYFSVGTTSYDMLNVPSMEIFTKTLNTINETKFNKVRMSLLPRYGDYHHEYPLYFPYEGEPPKNWDFTRFNVSFWKSLDDKLLSIVNLHKNIIMEVIFFMGSSYYNLSCIGGEDTNKYDTRDDELYIKYLVSRLSWYRNIWWSVGNEYDRTNCKNKSIPQAFPIWDSYFKTLIKYDPYYHDEFKYHEISIHQFKYFYNYSQPWCTHFSVQAQMDSSYADRTYHEYFKAMFNVIKPVILDECQYEGNITSKSNDLITGAYMTDRFYMAVGNGCYAGHSETILPSINDTGPNSNVLLWEYLGYKLRGKSWKLISFFSDFMRDTDTYKHPPFSQLINKCVLYHTKPPPEEYRCLISQLYKENIYYFFHWTQYVSNNYYATINVQFPIKKTYQLSLIDFVNQKIDILGYVNHTTDFIFTPVCLPYNVQLIDIDYL